MPPINESGVLFSHDKVTLNYASKKFCTYLLPQILENEKRKNPVIMKHLSFLLLYFVSLLFFCCCWELFVGVYICCLCQYSWVVLTG